MSPGFHRATTTVDGVADGVGKAFYGGGMVLYRRSRVANAPYFLTATLRERRSGLLVEYIDDLRSAFGEARQRRPFRIDAVVVLPDHFHLLCTLPEGDADFSSRVQIIKRAFTRSLLACGVPLVKDARGEYPLWQRRFWEHTIRDPHDYARHVDYIHFNPVKHGWVRQVRDWPYSSFHRYVRQGLLPADWGGAAPGCGKARRQGHARGGARSRLPEGHARRRRPLPSH